MLSLLALALAAPATAQEREPREQRRREEAVRRMEEAQRELQRALEQLRRAETEEAMRQLERTIRELREAERELDGRSGVFAWSDDFGGLRGELRDFGRAFSIVNSDGRPRMGVILETTRPGDRGDSLGARIQAVTPGGPADEAGLKAGDIVTRANGVALGRVNRRNDSPYERLVRQIRRLDEGDTLRVEYRRGNETGTANVLVRRLESSAYSFLARGDGTEMVDRIRVAPHVRPGARLFVGPEARVGPIELALPMRWLDIELVTLNPELGQYFGTAEGVLVVRAPSDQTLGLQSGDVILSIDGRTPTNPSHALRILRSYNRGETITIEVMRDKRRRTLTATVPEREPGGFFLEPEF